MPLTPERRLQARQSYGRAVEAFGTVAWRAPEPRRFDPHAANDPAPAEPPLRELAAELPRWVTVVAGGVVAAFVGALLGGALAV